jgi:hypothetical protein
MLASVPEEYWSQAWLSMRNFNRTDELAAVAIPTLVIAGATDGLLESNVADALRLQDGVLHVCAEAGHETAVNDPVGVARAIDGFLQGKCFSRKMVRQVVASRLAKLNRLPNCKHVWWIPLPLRGPGL